MRPLHLRNGGTEGREGGGGAVWIYAGVPSSLQPPLALASPNPKAEPRAPGPAACPPGLPTNLVGGAGALEPFSKPPPSPNPPPSPPGGGSKGGSLFSTFFMPISNHWFLISRSKTASPLVGAITKLPPTPCQT